jgi:hypothetical protein
MYLISGKNIIYLENFLVYPENFFHTYFGKNVIYLENFFGISGFEMTSPPPLLCPFLFEKCPPKPAPPTFRSFLCPCNKYLILNSIIACGFLANPHIC